MKTILFISQPLLENAICAIGISGCLWGDACSLSKKYNVLQFFAKSEADVEKLFIEHKPEIIFYMYCERTTPWMKGSWKKNLNCKHVLLDADINQNQIYQFEKNSSFDFDYLVSLDPSLDVSMCDKVFKVNNIMPVAEPGEYVDEGIVKIGFHGSPTLNKGIVELVDYIQTQFDDAEIRFHCPINFPNNGHSPEEFMENINFVKSRIFKPGIKFFLTTDIVSNQELVNRMSKNTINCYFNHNSAANFTSSSIQFALAARRPIAIRKTNGLKGYWDCKPSICVEETSIKDIIANGFAPLEPVYNKYSPQNVCKDFENIIFKITNPSKLSFSF